MTGISDIDAATRALYRQVRRTPALESAEERTFTPFDATVVIVPGALHKSHPESGSDGRAVREESEHLGMRVATIPLPDLGRLQENAGVICDWLKHHAQGPVVLYSISKGSVDVKMALARADACAAFRNVLAWVNICGPLDGNPLIGWLYSDAFRSYWTRFLLRAQGIDMAPVRELERRSDGPLAGPLQVPSHLQVIHVVAFPQRADLSSAFARRCHQRMAHCGPNDGAGLVLADALRWPGVIYPVAGADHYLRAPGNDLRSIARRTLGYLSEELKQRKALPCA